MGRMTVASTAAERISRTAQSERRRIRQCNVVSMPELARPLTRLNATAMVAGTIIGASIFVQPSEIARSLLFFSPVRARPLPRHAPLDHDRVGALRGAHAVRRAGLPRTRLCVSRD